MEKLCRFDGGVRIYETVTLPPHMFDDNGYPFPGWRVGPASQPLGRDYELRQEIEYLKRGDPVQGEGLLVRFRSQVISRAEGRILSEAVGYARSGGDFIVLGHFSSRLCPTDLGLPTTLLRETFIRE
jgi:hypothetical protein